MWCARWSTAWVASACPVPEAPTAPSEPHPARPVGRDRAGRRVRHVRLLVVRTPSEFSTASFSSEHTATIAWRCCRPRLLEHAAAYNLCTVMTFHQKVEEARAFADKLPRTAADLYVNDASDADLAAADRLPKSSIDADFYELEAGRHIPPDRVWSAWLCGDHTVAERREALRQFANGIDATGRRVHRAFPASVRVLGEGVDITGERGVEAVCFADTRGSQVEIVQNIGRALRLNKDGSTKVARIIVPVYLEPNEDPTDMVASASFRPLVAVLQGLRSHDERRVEQLASRALTSGKRKVHVQRDEDGRIVGAGEGDGEDQEGDDTGAAAEPALLHFSSPRDAATIAAFLRTQVYRPESLAWPEGYQSLVRWRAENEITGVHAVPYDVEAEVGVTKAFPLGRWVHQQRKALRAGELDPHRKELPGRARGRDGLGAQRGSLGEQARRAPLLSAGNRAPCTPAGRRVGRERSRGPGADRVAPRQPPAEGRAGQGPGARGGTGGAADGDRRGLELPVVAELAAALPGPRRPGRRRRRNPGLHRPRRSHGR